MSIAYQPKNELVASKALRVQELCLPFSIAGSATSANVVVTVDDPALLFIRTQGTDRITVASGGLDSADTAPTYTSPNDANGQFAILVRINEPVSKVISAELIRLDSQEVISCTLPSAPSSGIVAGGNLDKIALNADSGANFASDSPKYCLVVRYMASPR